MNISLDQVRTLRSRLYLVKLSRCAETGRIKPKSKWKWPRSRCSLGEELRKDEGYYDGLVSCARAFISSLSITPHHWSTCFAYKPAIGRRATRQKTITFRT